MNLVKSALFFVAALFVSPIGAMAQDCRPHLAAPKTGVAKFQLVTLNRNGVASSSSFDAVLRPPLKIKNGSVRPAQWMNSASGDRAPKVLFSDRRRSIGGGRFQPYDILKPDRISVGVTVEESPQVTVTLHSWGNVTARFRVRCSVSGVMYGSTHDVDYLLFLK